MRQARYLLLAGMAALVFLIQGCVALQVRQPLPEHLLEHYQFADLPGIRAWGDTYSESITQSAIESIKQEMAANHGKLEPETNFLALSGGGGDGAFGAGILCGWTAAGTRPRFKLVTGISTGALIAPFAFLGPEYDAKLKAAYTTISDKDIYAAPSLVKLVLNLGRVRRGGQYAAVGRTPGAAHRREHAAGHRRRAQQGQAPAGGDDPTRRPTPGDLEYGGHRRQPPPGSPQAVPPGAPGFGLHPRGLQSGLYQGEGRGARNTTRCTWMAVSGLR